MDLTEEPGDIAFREEVRAFVSASVPQDIRDKVRGFRQIEIGELVRWHKILHQRGWGGPAWPAAFGGTGWSVRQRAIFEEECAIGAAPRYFPAINMIGPVLQHYGTEAQKQHLPRILSMDEVWCQGYSEPGSGSDLASLKTRAVRRGDVYVVDGQKIWTSFAYCADWMFCLVRTSTEGKPQAGITFLLIDMKSPGITVRRIVGIGGAGDLCEVFFDGVEVPVSQRVHEENQGWTVAKHLLGFERTTLAGVGTCKFMLSRLKEIAGEPDGFGLRKLDDPLFASRVARVEIDLLAHVWMYQAALSDEDGAELSHLPSILKVRGSEIQQEIASLLFDCAGHRAGPFQLDHLFRGGADDADGKALLSGMASVYFDWRKATIYGGTTEVQKNIVAKQALGF